MPYINNRYENDNGYEDLFHIINTDRFKRNRMYAIRDAKSQDLYIIDPTETDKKKIETQWDNYMSMTKPFRRRADWITLEYLGLNNQQIYDFVYNRAERAKTSETPHINGNVGSSDQSINGIYESDISYYPANQEVPSMEILIDSIENFDLKAQEAHEYMQQTGYIIIIPGQYASINDLEHAYYAYNSMVLRHQRIADWKAVELFGMPNRELYICIRRSMNTQSKDSNIDDNIDPNRTLYHIDEFGKIRSYLTNVISRYDITNNELKTYLEKLNADQSTNYDKMVSKRISSSMQDMFDGLTVNVPSANYSYTDLPAYSPDELIDMGVYSGGDPESRTGGDDMIISKPLNERWFENYIAFYNSGIMTDEYAELNLHRVHELQSIYLDNAENHKDEILKLGWNPNAEFNVINRAINDSFMRQHFVETINYYDIIDVSENTIDVPEYLKEETNTNDKIPIFIVLSSGKSAFSDLIRGVTQSDYSHAMLSLDSSLHKCFSYGVDLNVKKLGSFIIEDVPKKFKDNSIRVYSVFVSSKIFETISTNVDWFIQNQKKTMYGWRNLITYLFKVPFERDHALICSQFVDKMLKLGHIDFTKKTSSLIAPSDLDKAASRSKKIYQIYKGFGGKWDQTKMMKKIESIKNKDKTYEWKFEYVSDDLPGGFTIHEVKDIPVQINTNGDVLIKNMKPTDFDVEYAKSHKLLIEYSKQNNIEGIKSELARLWTYLLKIEELLYGDKSISPSKRKQLFAVRAMIIGDFKKYIAEVQREEKDFDFSKYYENSLYSDSMYKVNGSTIHGLLKLVKELL